MEPPSQFYHITSQKRVITDKEVGIYRKQSGCMLIWFYVLCNVGGIKPIFWQNLLPQFSGYNIYILKEPSV
jgi:hypothetical protein